MPLLVFVNNELRGVHQVPRRIVQWSSIWILLCLFTHPLTLPRLVVTAALLVLAGLHFQPRSDLHISRHQLYPVILRQNAHITTHHRYGNMGLLSQVISLHLAHRRQVLYLLICLLHRVSYVQTLY